MLIIKRPLKKLLLFLLLLPLLVHSTVPITWQKNADFLEIGNRIERLEDTSGTLTIAQVSDAAMAGRFSLSKHKILNFNFSGNVTWLKISFANNTTDTLLLSLEQAVLPVADFYFKNNADTWQCYKAGYAININEKIVRHHYQVFPLATGSKQYYVRLISFSPPVSIKIWNIDAFELHSSVQKIAYGIYVGLLVFAILLNVFFAYAYRSIMFLQYSVLVFFYLTIATFVMDGYGLYFSHHVNLSITYPLVPLLTSISIIPFAWSFLEVEKYAPRLYKFSRFILGWLILYAAILVFVPQPIALVINQVDALLVTFLMISMGFSVGTHHNKIGFYFAIAYLIFFILVTFEIVYIQTGFPPCLFGISHVSVAIFIEAIALAYLLARRFGWEEAEAQMLLIRKTQENELLVLDQNIKLEETVKQRTQVIAQQKETVEKMLLEKEVLLKEIHHRVKNNLQTISSMLMLQSAGLKDEEAKKAITESRNRVSSIALIHQKLYQTDGFEKVELNAFVKDMAEQISAVYSEQSKQVTIHQHIPKTQIPIDIAVPLGLIINELFTNSFKYAFNNNPSGHIQIELSHTPTIPSSKIKNVVLIYRDNGTGLSSPELITTSTTLGLRLINLLSQQIGATICYDNANGSEFKFTFDINT